MLAVTLPPDGSAPIQYSGGTVLAAPRVIAIYLGTVWDYDPSLMAERSAMDGFLSYMARSPWAEELKEFNVSSMAFAGSVVDPVSFYNSLIPDPLVQNEINGYTRLYGYHAGDAFVVIPPPGISIARSEGDFPAYHDSFLGSYGVPVPYAITTQNIDPSQVVNASNTFDVLTVVASHEIAEMATDPFYRFGSLAWAQLPEGTNEGEICDVAKPGGERLNSYLFNPYWSNIIGIPYVPGARDNGLTPAPNVTLSASSTSPAPGTSITLTSTVIFPDASYGYPPPTGKVDFTLIKALDSSLNSGVGTPTDLGTATLSPAGVATLTVPNLSAGAYNVEAIYSGDSTFASIRADPIRITVGSSLTAHNPSASLTPPASPTRLLARAMSTTKVRLTWRNQPHSTATSFVIDRSTSADFLTFDRISTSGLKLAYIDSGLSPGTVYYYRVYAVNVTAPSEFFTNTATVRTRGIATHSLRKLLQRRRP